MRIVSCYKLYLCTVHQATLSMPSKYLVYTIKNKCMWVRYVWLKCHNSGGSTWHWITRWMWIKHFNITKTTLPSLMGNDLGVFLDRKNAIVSFCRRSRRWSVTSGRAAPTWSSHSSSISRTIIRKKHTSAYSAKHWIMLVWALFSCILLMSIGLYLWLSSEEFIIFSTSGNCMASLNRKCLYTGRHFSNVVLNSGGIYGGFAGLITLTLSPEKYRIQKL